jgi:SAM-dependent methyltransferase
MLAIDRSATQIARARRRNRAHLESGTLRLATADLGSLEVEPGSFDAVFAVNVNAFWIGPATRELAIVKRALAPGGRLVLVYETPTSARADEARERLEAVLVAERFGAPVVHRASPTLFACIAQIT